MTEGRRTSRDDWMPIAVVEHHMTADPVFSPHDMCDRLGQLWPIIRREAEAKAFTLDSASVLAVHASVARSLGGTAGPFRNPERWAGFVGELTAVGGIEEDPSHGCGWIFAALYWNHLARFRLATAWSFVNAMRVQHGLPEYRLSMHRLGPFLDSLSGAGPPTYDGQTFYPEEYAPDRPGGRPPGKA